jgi:hypothetical protein
MVNAIGAINAINAILSFYLKSQSHGHTTLKHRFSRRVLYRAPPYGFYRLGPPLSAIVYIGFYFWFYVARASTTAPISPEGRARHAPLYNASSILVSVKTRLSIFVEQVSNSCPCHVE